MAITADTIKVQYNPAVPTNEFPFNIRYFKNTDVNVDIVDISGDTVTLTLNAVTGGFTVIVTGGDPENGGTIHTTEDYSLGDIVTIYREVPILQENQWGVATTIPPDTLNDAFDRQTAVSQQISEGNERTLTAPITDPDALNYEVPAIATRAGKVISFDGIGNLEMIDPNFAGVVTDYQHSTHIGDGVTTAFTLEFTPNIIISEAFRVSIDGIVQTPDDAYSITATDIVFTSIPPIDSEISVVTTSKEGAIDLSYGVIKPTGTSTSRSLRDKLGEVISVKDFGAIGDGVTDDKDAFNNALIYLNSLGGGKLYIPSGTYNIVGVGGSYTDRYIQTYSNIEIVGETEGTTIIKRGGDFSIFTTGPSVAGAGYDLLSNIKFRNLTIDGNSDAFNTPSNLIYIESTTNVVVEDCTFIDTPGLHALDLNRVKDVNVNRCSFFGTDLSIAINYAGTTYYPEAIQLSFGDSESAGGYVENVFVSNCVFGKSNRVGSDYFYTAMGNHTTDGVNLPIMKNVNFYNNVVDGSEHSAVRACPCDGFHVHDNVFKNSKSVFAIWINTHQEYGNVDSKNISFNNNTIQGVINNVIYTTHNEYLVVGDIQRLINMRIEGNVISGQSASTTSAIFTLNWVTNLQCLNNIIEDECFQYIGLEYTANATIQGNDVNSTRLNGVYVFESNDVSLKGLGYTNNIQIFNNNFKNALYRGIHVSCAGVGIRIIGNNIVNPNLLDGGREGIKLDSGYDDIEISNNRVSYDTIAHSYGINVSSVTNVVIGQNNVQDGSSGTIGSSSVSCQIIGGLLIATPESSISALVGSTVVDSVGGKLYVKETGTGNTGWIVK